MGIWILRVKPENPNSHMHRKPRFITGLNYDFDLHGGKIALLYQQAIASLDHNNCTLCRVVHKSSKATMDWSITLKIRSAMS